MLCEDLDGWDGGSEAQQRGLMYSRDHHNTVKQLFFKKKISHLGWIDKRSNPSGFEIRNAGWNLPLAHL